MVRKKGISSRDWAGRPRFFTLRAMAKRSGSDKSNGVLSLAEVQTQQVCRCQEISRARRLLGKHHYLGDIHAVGEQLWYAITARG